MKKLILFSLFTAIAGTAGAQQKLDLESSLTLLRERSGNTVLPSPGDWGKRMSYANSKGAKITEYVKKPMMPGFIELANDDARQQLVEAGVDILRTRGNIALASIPTDEVETIAALPCVKRVQLARKVKPMMKSSRAVTGVDKIHAGEDLPQAYTGKGVVCGIIDNGFDPNHVNFLKSDGTTRFGYMSNIYKSSQSSDGYIYENYYPRTEIVEGDELKHTYAIEDFKCDDKTDFHGTHTLGIMAGGYHGEVTAATVEDGDPQSVITKMQNPYYGCATDAELVASTGDFDYYDMFIAYGLDDCINYALYSNGVDADGMPVKEKPCVINMSIGRILGAHDPNGLLNRYFAAAGEDEAIICMSAGNEADYPVCLNKTFADDDKTLQSFIKPIEEGKYTQSGTSFYNLRYGDMYVYSSDEKEFEIQVVVYNQKRGSVAMRIPVSTNTNGSYVIYASSEDYASSATINQTFAKAFDGYIAIGTMLDEDTNRYYAYIRYMTSDNQESNADGNYILGLVVNGKSGQRIDVYGDAQYTYFDSYGKNGWQDGTKDGTINDLAVGENVIVVGSWNNTTRWGGLDGTVQDFDGGLPEGEVSVFSSYATMPSGKTLPTVCAPGTAVISSANGYYIENKSMGITSDYIQAKATENGRNQYWIASTGTSMSTPLVAGAIATWLEADPTLKSADVVDIIQKTAKRDEFVEKGNQVQWGAGKFDAYAGLQEVLRRKAASGIEEVENGKWKMENGELQNAPVYNLQGQRVGANAKGLVIKGGKKIMR